MAKYCLSMSIASKRNRFFYGCAFALAMMLGGCASGPAPEVTPRPGAAPWYERDGAEANPPADLARVPDAEPQLEPVRLGGPNKPYEVLGRAYVPQRGDEPYVERGLASWYGRKFHGRRTANGEVYNMYAMTAAHKTLPLPSYARVRNPKNGREVVVRVNDRGPFHGARVIDLSYTAALKLGLLNGVANVEVERITPAKIRTGAWRRPEAAPPDSMPAPTAAAAPVQAAAEVPSPSSITPAQDASPPPADAQPLEVAAPAAVAEAPSEGPRFWLQLGAFRQREGAEHLQRQVAGEASWLAPLLAVLGEPPSLFKLQAGPYAGRPEAMEALRRIREVLKLTPVLVERER